MITHHTSFLYIMLAAFFSLQAMQQENSFPTSVTRCNTAQVTNIMAQLEISPILYSTALSDDGKRILVRHINDTIQQYEYAEKLIEMTQPPQATTLEKLRLLDSQAAPGDLPKGDMFFLPNHVVGVHSDSELFIQKLTGKPFYNSICPALEKGSHVACTEVAGKLITACYYPSTKAIRITDVAQQTYCESSVALGEAEGVVQLAFTHKSNNATFCLAALMATTSNFAVQFRDYSFDGKAFSINPQVSLTILPANESYELAPCVPTLGYSPDGCYYAVVNRMPRTIAHINVDTKNITGYTNRTIYSVFTDRVERSVDAPRVHECVVPEKLQSIAISSVQVSPDGTKVLCDGFLFDMNPREK